MIVICIYCIIAPLIPWIYIAIHAGIDMEKIEIIRQNCIKSTHPNCSSFTNGSNLGHTFDSFGHLPNFSYDYKLGKVFDIMWPINLVFSVCMLSIVVVGWYFYQLSEKNRSIVVFYGILLAHLFVYETIKKEILSPELFYQNTSNVLYDMNFGYDIADNNKSVYLMPYFNKTYLVTKPVPSSTIRKDNYFEYDMYMYNRYPFFCLSRKACDQEIYKYRHDTYCFLRNCLKTNSSRIENSLPLDLDLYKVYPSHLSNKTVIKYHGPAMNQSKIIYLITFAIFILITLPFSEFE